MFLIGFPLLLVPFAIYNIVAFLMPGTSWTSTLATVHMMSGADWAMSGGDMLVTLAILLLFVEMMKAAQPGSRGVVDHGLSLLLFLAMTAEFVLVKQAASYARRTHAILIVHPLVTYEPRFPASRPLARNHLRSHGGDLAPSCDADRDRYAACRWQRG